MLFGVAARQPAPNHEDGCLVPEKLEEEEGGIQFHKRMAGSRKRGREREGTILRSEKEEGEGN